MEHQNKKMAAKKETSVIRYCFTYNNYTTIGEDKLKEWLSTNTKYAVYGHEIAPKTGTPHLQGMYL